MGAPLFIPRPLREPLTVNVARSMKLVGPVLTQVARRIPMGPMSTSVLRFSGFMLPMAKPSDVKRAVREFLTTPVDWYMHLAVHASEHPRVSLSAIKDVPAAFVAGRFDVLASSHDMRTAAHRMDDASYVNLLGSHFLPLERSATITGMLRDFVAHVDDAG